ILGKFLVRPVSTKLGETAFTRILLFSNSFARALVKPISPYFAVAYPLIPAAEEPNVTRLAIFTILPASQFANKGRNAFTTLNAPWICASICFLKSFQSESANRL